MISICDEFKAAVDFRGNDKENSDAGGQYLCGWVSNPHPHPKSPTYIHKMHLKRSFSLFTTRVHGRRDRQIDVPMDGQSLL